MRLARGSPLLDISKSAGISVAISTSLLSPTVPAPMKCPIPNQKIIFFLKYPSLYIMHL